MIKCDSPNHLDMSDAHVIIFDDDCFGVMYLEIQFFVIYIRIKENLKAAHYQDIQPEE